MRIAGIRPTSLFDGVGINYVVFVQGCKHHCENCQNPSTWSPNGGKEATVEEIIDGILPYLDIITGVTFSGGDPIEQYEEIAQIAAWAKKHRLRTTLYTGYSFDDLVDYNLDNIDYLIDEKYIDSLRSTECSFRGSTNQHIWHQTKGRVWERID